MAYPSACTTTATKAAAWARMGVITVTTSSTETIRQLQSAMSLGRSPAESELLHGAVPWGMLHELSSRARRLHISGAPQQTRSD